MARYHQETRLTPEILRNIAADLQDLAAEYADIAAEMETKRIGSINVESYKSVVRGLKEFESHLVKAYTAYTRTRRRTPDPDETEPPGERPNPGTVVMYAAEQPQEERKKCKP